MRQENEPLIEAKLATMETAQGVRHWCSELYIDGRFDHASEWTTSVADAVRAQHDLTEQALSDIAYRDARNEAYRLFHPAA